MSINFQIGDLISRINVGCIGNRANVKIVNTKMNIAILKFLIKKNLIQNYLVLNEREILLYLRSVSSNGYMFKKIEVISKPSKRVYFRWKNNKTNLNMKKYSIVLIATSKGLISLQEALYNKIGGEVVLGIRK